MYVYIYIHISIVAVQTEIPKMFTTCDIIFPKFKHSQKRQFSRAFPHNWDHLGVFHTCKLT